MDKELHFLQNCLTCLRCFNPCFNGFMDKEQLTAAQEQIAALSFNPCFNGFMDKEHTGKAPGCEFIVVSILVLMDSWIKSSISSQFLETRLGFNPCFNGFMDKENTYPSILLANTRVSILVLMDSWIKSISRQAVKSR